MARGLDSDYIGSLLLMDGFDMSINFDGLGENMKKFMEVVPCHNFTRYSIIGLILFIQADK